MLWHMYFKVVHVMHIVIFMRLYIYPERMIGFILIQSRASVMPSNLRLRSHLLLRSFDVIFLG